MAREQVIDVLRAIEARGIPLSRNARFGFYRKLEHRRALRLARFLRRLARRLRRQRPSVVLAAPDGGRTLLFTDLGLRVREQIHLSAGEVAYLEDQDPALARLLAPSTQVPGGRGGRP